MSIKTRENLNAESEEQVQRRALAQETIDRIIRETSPQISVEMYARSVAWEAYAAGWNNKADEARPLLEGAINLGREQAQEWDRYWKAAGVGTEEISVDDAIKLWQDREERLKTLQAALAVVCDAALEFFNDPALAPVKARFGPDTLDGLKLIAETRDKLKAESI